MPGGHEVLAQTLESAAAAQSARPAESRRPQRCSCARPGRAMPTRSPSPCVRERPWNPRTSAAGRRCCCLHGRSRRCCAALGRTRRRSGRAGRPARQRVAGHRCHRDRGDARGTVAGRAEPGLALQVRRSIGVPGQRKRTCRPRAATGEHGNRREPRERSGMVAAGGDHSSDGSHAYHDIVGIVLAACVDPAPADAQGSRRCSTRAPAGSGHRRHAAPGGRLSGPAGPPPTGLLEGHPARLPGAVGGA